MSELPPPPVAECAPEPGAQALSADQVEGVLGEFRAWLQEFAQPPGALPPLPPAPPDLHTLLGQLIALKHEVKLQTRAVRSQQEQNAQTLQQLSQALATLQQSHHRVVEQQESSLEEQLRPLLKTLVDAADALELAQREVERVRPYVSATLDELVDLLEELSEPQATEIRELSAAAAETAGNFPESSETSPECRKLPESPNGSGYAEAAELAPEAVGPSDESREPADEGPETWAEHPKPAAECPPTSMEASLEPAEQHESPGVRTAASIAAAGPQAAIPPQPIEWCAASPAPSAPEIRTHWLQSWWRRWFGPQPANLPAPTAAPQPASAEEPVPPPALQPTLTCAAATELSADLASPSAPTHALDTAAVKEMAERSRILTDRVRKQLDSLLTGYNMSLTRVARALEQHGLEPISCIGEPFDPERMEVVEVVEDSGRPGGEVVDEVRTGYLWRDRVFRFAQVRVAKP